LAFMQDEPLSEVNFESQYVCFLLRLHAIKTRNAPLIHSVRSDSIKGRLGECRSPRASFVWSQGSSLLVLQTRDWHRIMFCASPDKVLCVFLKLSVRPVAKIHCEPQGPIRLKFRLIQEAISTPFSLKNCSQFQLAATNTMNDPTSRQKGVSLARRLHCGYHRSCYT
jgi:hypothetical protein